jgi:hypothetical protein
MGARSGQSVFCYLRTMTLNLKPVFETDPRETASGIRPSRTPLLLLLGGFPPRRPPVQCGEPAVRGRPWCAAHAARFAFGKSRWGRARFGQQ